MSLSVSYPNLYPFVWYDKSKSSKIFFCLVQVLQLMNDLNEVFKMPLSLVLRLVNSIFDIVCVCLLQPTLCFF